MSNENIILPAMSDQMTEAELLTWKVNTGDEVKKGDVIAEIATDKVDMDLDSPFDGKIIKLNVEEGSMVNVGDTLAEIEVEGDSLLGSLFD
jgi:pyruvate dehydrogenase E2 component (dihydrolipoamide acetyltransferase)|tara:strand:+ start:171 stop:443 length:273 start_codon:yes stop_codon:yes gene_type:complete